MDIKMNFEELVKNVKQAWTLLKKGYCINFDYYDVGIALPTMQFYKNSFNKTIIITGWHEVVSRYFVNIIIKLWILRCHEFLLKNSNLPVGYTL